MAEPFTTSRLREAPAAVAAARIASRRKTADQRLRILERLTMGLTVVPPLKFPMAFYFIASALSKMQADVPIGSVFTVGS
jgi:hypothetical protein